MAKEKTPKMKTEKPKKEKIKKQKVQTQPKVVEVKHVKVPKKQKALAEKKAKLAVRARQTKWAPVWVIIKKYGAGKRIHPSAVTAYRRNWRRTKLHIKPRKIRKWHMG
jgi:ribosomal protein L39E